MTTESDEKSRYNTRNILRSERMYGEGFQSPGKLAILEEFCSRLALRPGLRVLDIGSGLGGSAFYLAEHYQAQVLGLDVAPTMVALSSERRDARGLTSVHFENGDVRSHDLAAGTFDLVWSRDCILYIPEKDVVWAQVARAVRPGGQVFITDFCRRSEAVSAEFQEYLDAVHYHLQDISTYAAAMERAGLAIVSAEDQTARFIAEMERELATLEQNRAEFLKEYSESDYHYLTSRWEKKLSFCREGSFRWGWFVARRVSPTSAAESLILSN